VRDRFLQKCQPLAQEFQRGREGQPSDIAAGSRQAGDELAPNRIGDEEHDDRDTLGRIFCPERGGFRHRDDHLYLALNQLCRQGRQELIPSLAPATLNDEILALDPATPHAALQERLVHGLLGFAGARAEIADTIDPSRRLRLGGARRGEETSRDHRLEGDLTGEAEPVTH
jgi:hypothetical protein